MFFKKGNTGLAIIVSLVIICLLALGGFLAYKYDLFSSLFNEENPQVIIPEIPPMKVVVKFVDYKTQESIKINYSIYEQVSENFFNLSSSGFVYKGSQLFLELPVNRTYYIYGYSDDYYTNFVAIVTFPRSKLFNTQLGMHKKAKQVNMYLSEDIKPKSEQLINLTFNTTDEFRNIGICLDWNFGVVYAKIPASNVKVPSTPRRFLNYEKCYDTDVTIMQGKQIVVPLDVKTLDITPADFLKVTIFDQERPFITGRLDYVFEDSTGNDVGVKDFSFDLLEKFK